LLLRSRPRPSLVHLGCRPGPRVGASSAHRGARVGSPAFGQETNGSPARRGLAQFFFCGRPDQAGQPALLDAAKPFEGRALRSREDAGGSGPAPARLDEGRADGQHMNRAGGSGLTGRRPDIRPCLQAEETFRGRSARPRVGPPHHRRRRPGSGQGSSSWSCPSDRFARVRRPPGR